MLCKLIEVQTVLLRHVETQRIKIIQNQKLVYCYVKSKRHKFMLHFIFQFKEK